MITKIKKSADFEMISRHTLQDVRLEMDELGLLVHLLSYPAGWEIRPTHLKKKTGWGKDRLRRVIDKLQRCGYLNRRQIHLKSGEFRWTSQLFSEAQPVDFKEKESKEKVKGESSVGNHQLAGQPVAGNPATEEPVDGQPADIDNTHPWPSNIEANTNTIKNNNKQQIVDVVESVNNNDLNDLIKYYFELQKKLNRPVRNPPALARWLGENKTRDEIVSDIAIANEQLQKVINFPDSSTPHKSRSNSSPPESLEILSQWVQEKPDDWLRKIIAQGVGKLVVDKRKNQPFRQEIVCSAGLFEMELKKHGYAVTQEEDALRIKIGFDSARTQVTDKSGQPRWPTVKEVLSLIPIRKGQGKIDNLPTKEQMERNKAAAKVASDAVNKLINNANS